MTCVNEIRQKDIVWVTFPYSDMSEKKFRPAVVVSNDEYNRKNQDVVACAITSRLEERQYTVLIDEKNVEIGKLPIKSRIRADKIMQIEKSLIAKPFARLNNKTFDLLLEEINKLLGRSK